MKIKLIIGVILLVVLKTGLTIYNSHLQTEREITRKKIKQVIKDINNKGDQKLSKRLRKLNHMIRQIPEDRLAFTWQQEYGCYVDGQCEYQLLNAHSIEEAQWMRRHGYLAKSLIDSLQVTVKNDLKKLANHGSVQAVKLLTIHAIMTGDLEKSIEYSTKARRLETPEQSFALRLQAQAYLLNNDINSAAIALKKAILLGDYEAEIVMQKIMQNHDDNIKKAIDTLTFEKAFINEEMSLLNVDNRPLK